MSQGTDRPLPSITPLTRPFWEAARRHELVLQRCQDCGGFRYPPGETCPGCLSERLEWVKASGRGRVFTWTVFHRAYHPAFARAVPYAVVAVELEEGPRLISNLVDCPLEALRIGLPVEVVFEDASPEISLPKFRPAV